MAVLVNTAMLRTTSASSDAIDVLGVVIHPTAPGDYEGEVWRGKQRLSVFTLAVAKEDRPSSVQVDLHMLAAPGAAGAAPKFRAAAADWSPGYVVFHASAGDGGFHVILAQKGEAVFDSRRLGPGDMFAVTLLRPGGYDMAAGGKRQGRIEVKPAKPRAELRREFGAGNVQVTADALKPKGIEIEAGDAVVFALAAPAAITVSFRKPRAEKTRRPARPVRIYAAGVSSETPEPTPKPKPGSPP